MHGDSHVPVAARARNVEQTEPFHEERTLFVKKHREALIHLNLKRVALNLTEVRIDRAVECDVRRDAEFSAQAGIRLARDPIPAVRRGPRFAEWIGSARNHL